MHDLCVGPKIIEELTFTAYASILTAALTAFWS